MGPARSDAGWLDARSQKRPGPILRMALNRAAQSVRDTLDPPRGPVESAGRKVDWTLGNYGWLGSSLIGSGVAAGYCRARPTPERDAGRRAERESERET
jgi:hypothetical protein